MLATRNLFLRTSCDDLDTVEDALIVNSGEGAQTACARLAAIAQGAGIQGLVRTARIANAAELLVGRGPEARALALRAILRLRDLLRTLNESQAEPPGDDSDILAAATEPDRPPSIADTLALARERLLEIAAHNRDPRLDALLERIANLGSEIEADSDDAPAVEKTDALKDSIVLRRVR